jgi:hypothetical protein
MSAPAPLLGEKQTSGGRLAATDFMSTHPNLIPLQLGPQKSPFDDIDHKLLPQAVQKHATDKWALPYIERWLTAQMDATTMRQRLDLARNAFLKALCHQNGR